MLEKLKEQLLIVNIVLIIITLVMFISWFFLPKTHVKVGYVRIAVILDKFLGTREAQRKLEGKMSSWQASQDTLKKRFDKFVDSLRKSNGNKEINEEGKNLLYRKQQEFENYSQNIHKTAQSEEQKTMDGVYKQINSFVEQYAKDYGYDVVLGTTPDGSLMYGHKALDITEEVTDALNKQYKK
jgi:outer membrane protein